MVKPGSKSANLVFVGEVAVGKTSLLIRYTTGEFPRTFVPTVCENYAITKEIEGQSYNIALSATSGQENYKVLRPLSYKSADVVLICFHIMDPKSLTKVTTNWLLEARENCPDIPIILVGMQIDLRNEYWSQAEPNPENIELECVTMEMGKVAAQNLGAFAYVECSAVTNAGVEDVFGTAIRAHLASTFKRPRKSSIFDRLKDVLSKTPAKEPEPIPISPPQRTFSSPVSPTTATFRARGRPKPPTQNRDTVSPRSSIVSATYELPPTITPSNSFQGHAETHFYPPYPTIRDSGIGLVPETPTKELPSVPMPLQEVVQEYDFKLLYKMLGGPVGESAAEEFGTRDWSSYITKEEEFCIGGGRFGDVYKGKWTGLPRSVPEPPQAVMKVIRPISGSQREDGSGTKVIRYLKREIAVWQDLHHENIVSFIGVCFNFGKLPALISLYMENGTVNVYLEDHPEADRREVNIGIARGLEYLHSQRPEIIHGDLKAVNILVDCKGRPRLTDFGLSRVVDDSTMWVTTATSAQGSIRWMAPELLSGSQTTVHAPSDVYAFAMTSLEVITGKVPFAQYSKDGAVMTAVAVRSERPSRPRLDVLVSDAIWKLWQRCWLEDPPDRPRMSEVVMMLELERGP